jgi:hypothetical protein
MKIIRLTEKQLREATGDVPFEYLDDNDTKSYSGNNAITAVGKIEQDEYGDPTQNKTDDIARTQSSILPYRIRYSTVRNVREAYGADGQENYPDVDTDKDGINNFYDNVNMSNNSLETNSSVDDTTEIPTSILQKVDNLINSIKQCNLMPKKQAQIVAKIIDMLDIEDLSTATLKNLSLHMKSKSRQDK